MRPPTSSDASREFYVFFWRRIDSLSNRISCYSVHEFELDIARRSSKGDGIAPVCPIGEVKDQNFLELE
jgi:hypothetical protein